MPIGTCPKCGSDRMENAAERLIIPAVVDLSLNPRHSPISTTSGLLVKAIVCQECGYVELFYAGT
jgi:predicted nucleic-acid-binding Zn-ribbon protein